ncbi:hypothetical protein EJ05DRAFT_471638, partial [Pseudovirgaria hyperparasitica]
MAEFRNLLSLSYLYKGTPTSALWQECLPCFVQLNKVSFCSGSSEREDLKLRYDMSLARFQLAYSPRRPLPPCEGPKLLPFKRHKGNIHFLKLLSSSPRLDGSEGAEGGHSYVFKVRIGKKKYALKVVSKYAH